MKCPNCGKESQNGVSFCSECGFRFENQQSYGNQQPNGGQQPYGNQQPNANQGAYGNQGFYGNQGPYNPQGNMPPKKSKGWIIALIIIGAVIFLALTGVLVFFLVRGFSNNDDSKTNTTISSENQTSFIQANNLTVSPANQTYNNRAYTYALDDEGRQIINEGLIINQKDATFRLYNYTETMNSDSETRTISFKYDMTIPAEVTEDVAILGGSMRLKLNAIYYTPNVFDGNTGDEYDSEEHGVGDASTTSKNNTVLWNGTTYNVAVSKNMISGGWDPSQKETLQDGTLVFTTTYRQTGQYTITVPIDYYGPMIALNKIGVDQSLYNAYVSNKEANDADRPTKKFYETAYKNYQPTDYYIMKISDVPK